MSFCASRRVLQVMFFCIMSWSRPVITITTKMPLRNCFQKFWRLAQSSNTKTRLCGSAVTLATTSWKSRLRLPIAATMMSTRAASMHVVWNVSDHTRVFTPARRV